MGLLARRLPLRRLQLCRLQSCGQPARLLPDAIKRGLFSGLQPGFFVQARLRRIGSAAGRRCRRRLRAQGAGRCGHCSQRCRSSGRHRHRGLGKRRRGDNGRLGCRARRRVSGAGDIGGRGPHIGDGRGAGCWVVGRGGVGQGRVGRRCVGRRRVSRRRVGRRNQGSGVSRGFWPRLRRRLPRGLCSHGHSGGHSGCHRSCSGRRRIRRGQRERGHARLWLPRRSRPQRARSQCRRRPGCCRLGRVEHDAQLGQRTASGLPGQVETRPARAFATQRQAEQQRVGEQRNRQGHAQRSLRPLAVVVQPLPMAADPGAMGPSAQSLRKQPGSVGEPRPAHGLFHTRQSTGCDSHGSGRSGSRGRGLFSCRVADGWRLWASQRVFTK